MEYYHFKTLENNNQQVYARLFNYPNVCPYCHKNIIPEFSSDYLDKDLYYIYATLVCPNSECDTPALL